MKIGVFLPSLAARGDQPGDIAAAARHAEDLGFESVWAVDQLIAGSGDPLLESTVVLAAAAGATRHVRLGFGLMILPLRPVVWAAKEIASLQYVSRGRVLLGVGAGGERHRLSWAAAGVSYKTRGRLLDHALAVLPDLIAGKAAPLAPTPAVPVQLSPGVAVPPIVVGGMSQAAMTRAAKYADAWFPVGLEPGAIPDARDRLDALTSAQARPAPSITTSMMIAIDADPSIPSADAVVRSVTDPHGSFAIPTEVVPTMLVAGSAAAVAERLAAYSYAGVDRVVVTVAAGDWARQTELLARASERQAAE